MMVVMVMMFMVMIVVMVVMMFMFILVLIVVMVVMFMFFFLIIKFRNDIAAGNDDVHHFFNRHLGNRFFNDFRIFIEFSYDFLGLFNRLFICDIGMGKDDCIGCCDLVIEVFLEIDVILAAGLDIDDADMGNDTEIRIALDDVDDLGELADTRWFNQQISYAHLFDLFQGVFKIAL